MFEPRTPLGGSRSRRGSTIAGAFEELLADHLDALYRTALRLCGGRKPDAEDLLQDATLRAFEHFGQLRHQDAGRSWLFTVLSRTYLNRSRAERRRAETAAADLDEPAFEAALAAWQPIRTPHDVLEDSLLGEQIAAALDQLGPELRSVVWLADVEGFVQREVARMLDIPEGTVASRLFRARRELRTLLERRAGASRTGGT